MAGLNREIWLAQIMEMYEQGYSWLQLLDDLSAFVTNNTINIAEAGIDPVVLLNNITYPVPIVERTDVNFELPLDIFDTENTIVRNARNVELSYDKMASVLRGHVRSLKAFGASRASHAIAPSSNGEFTPVLATSGAVRNGFKMITEDDIFLHAEQYDNIDAPDEGRTLVLHPTMFNDIVRTSPTLKEQRKVAKEGMINRAAYELAGFRIEKFRGAAVYNKTTGAKKAFGAAATPLTDTISSFSFVQGEVMKAVGDYEMFEQLKTPKERGDIIGFQQRFIAMPKRNKYLGAIYQAAE